MSSMSSMSSDEMKNRIRHWAKLSDYRELHLHNQVFHQNCPSKCINHWHRTIIFIFKLHSWIFEFKKKKNQILSLSVQKGEKIGWLTLSLADNSLNSSWVGELF